MAALSGCIFVSLLVAADPPARLSVAACTVHAAASKAAIDALPEVLREFLRSQAAANGGTASTATTDLACTCYTAMPDPEHYILLDAEAKDAGAEDRARAAEIFPHDRPEAERLFKRCEVSRGGKLPWALEEHVDRLRDALRSSEANRIHLEMSTILHLSADAALPLNVTCAAFKPSADEAIEPLSPSESLPGMGPRKRIHRFLADRLELCKKVTVKVEAVVETRNVREVVFKALLEAFKQADQLLMIDRAAMERSRVIQEPESAVLPDAYAAHMAASATDLLTSRVAAGAELGASLVWTAWRAAGEPALPMVVLPAPSDEKSPAVAATAPFVGSRNSKVFHRIDCLHVGRIKSENMVWFATQEEAAKAGRTPCKQCLKPIP